MIAHVNYYPGPNISPRHEHIILPDDVQEKYHALLERGCELTVEVLRNGNLSCCIEHKYDDYVMRIIPSFQEVVSTLTAMIKDVNLEVMDDWIVRVMDENE